MRVVFMGTPAFALPTLEALLGSHHEVVAAYSQPPRPAGRGQKLTPSPIHQRAATAGIPIYTPTSLKSSEAQAEFAALRADVAVVAAYGLLLPQAILDAHEFGCINLHPSALPRWRGAAPLQRTLMAGDASSACCIMQMEAGLDTGPVLLREDVPIPPEMDAGALHDVMANLGAHLILRTLDLLEQNAAQPVVQSAEGITYAAKITKDDQQVHWNHTAHAIHNQVRGLSPAPGAIAAIPGETIKIYRSLPLPQSGGTPGQWIDAAQGIIACGEGSALQLLEVQRPGGKRMAFAEFAKGMKS